MENQLVTVEEILAVGGVKGIVIVGQGSGWVGHRYKLEIWNYQDLGPFETLEELRESFQRNYRFMCKRA